MNIYFSDVFEVSEEKIETAGAFNISLVTDLPLFIDPFLLFYSESADYKQLHDDIVRYVMFLKGKARVGGISHGQLKMWFHFPEVKQTWLGFALNGNDGRGLGSKFAG